MQINRERLIWDLARLSSQKGEVNALKKIENTCIHKSLRKKMHEKWGVSYKTQTRPHVCLFAVFQVDCVPAVITNTLIC